MLDIKSIRPSPPPFFRLASTAFPDVGSVSLIEKNPKEKITRSIGIGGPGTPG